MLCYDCANSMKVTVQTVRQNMNYAEAPRGSHTVRICLVHPDIFGLLRKNLQTNFIPDVVVGTEDLLVKHCTKYQQRPLVDQSCSIQPENLAQEVGSTYVDDQKSPTDQWQRIIGLLNKNGFTIVRREIDK